MASVISKRRKVDAIAFQKTFLKNTANRYFLSRHADYKITEMQLWRDKTHKLKKNINGQQQ